MAKAAPAAARFARVVCQAHGEGAGWVRSTARAGVATDSSKSGRQDEKILGCRESSWTLETIAAMRGTMAIFLLRRITQIELLADCVFPSSS